MQVSNFEIKLYDKSEGLELMDTACEYADHELCTASYIFCIHGLYIFLLTRRVKLNNVSLYIPVIIEAKMFLLPQNLYIDCI
jgi:hypothetical protein